MPPPPSCTHVCIHTHINLCPYSGILAHGSSGLKATDLENAFVSARLCQPHPSHANRFAHLRRWTYPWTEVSAHSLHLHPSSCSGVVPPHLETLSGRMHSPPPTTSTPTHMTSDMSIPKIYCLTSPQPTQPPSYSDNWSPTHGPYMRKKRMFPDTTRVNISAGRQNYVRKQASSPLTSKHSSYTH